MQITLKNLNLKPFYATEDSAGLDLYCDLGDDSVWTIPVNGWKAIPTGLCIALPPQTVGFVIIRSGLAFKHDLSLINAVGVIDADFRGEIKVGIRNHGINPYYLKNKTRIAQLIVLPFLQVPLNLVRELPATIRNENGLGSTGDK